MKSISIENFTNKNCEGEMMNKGMLKFTGLLGGSLFALSVHSVASAQVVAQSEESAAVSSQGFAGDIVVTAEKRSTSIQKVPVAVTALSGEAMARSGINDIVTLAARVPNFNFGETFGAAKLSIRGISFSNLSTGAEGSVAYNLNDVYIARPAGQLGNFYDIDRVEVLRGPQGTLYGRNATGGAVNVYTARPTKSWTGFGQLTVGNYNDIIVEGGVGGPLTDNIGVRLAFFGRDRDGYGKNVLTGNDVDDANVRGGRLTLSYTPATNFSAEVIADIGRERDHSNVMRVIAQRGLSGDPGVSGFPIYAVQLGARVLIKDYDIAANIDTQYRRHTGGVAVNLKWDLGDLNIRSLSAWRRTHFQLATDIDGSSADFARIYYDELSNQYSQEFDLTYTGKAIDLTAGAFAFAENLNGFFWTPGTIRTAPRPGAPTGLPQPGLFIGNFAAGGKLETRAYAIFGQASWHVTDQLTLIAGARYSTEKKFDGDLYTDFTQTLFRQPAGFDPLTPPLSGPFN
ncbi:TonB-dependent receptor, partial [Rhizorhabdus wittichii]|uniref:TonB-dependent receptor n=1 Tax=Rhizorhabdus wittichii TaxID=160791 RepID=UPI0012FE387A